VSDEKFRVVAVDDDPDVLQLVRLTLNSEYELITISDPAKALASLDYIEPDFVLLDIMMPKITGYQILEAIRKDARHQAVQVIVLSAKDSNHDVKYGYKLGANFYLTKPFQPERVKRTLEMMRTQGTGMRPRKKVLSRRDCELRLQMGVAAAPGTGTPAAGLQMKFRRPLGAEHASEPADDEDSNKRKDWVG